MPSHSDRPRDELRASEWTMYAKNIRTGERLGLVPAGWDDHDRQLFVAVPLAEAQAFYREMLRIARQPTRYFDSPDRGRPPELQIQSK